MEHYWQSFLEGLIGGFLGGLVSLVMYKEYYCKNNTLTDTKKKSNPQGQDNEQGYLTLMKHVMERGYEVKDRTGTGALFLPGQKVEYDLTNYAIPLLTTRRVPWHNVVGELLFFLKGETDTNKLVNSNPPIRIWIANTTKEFIEQRGLSDKLQPGEMGPLYGRQWRNFGRAEEKNGVDQIVFVMNELKHNRGSRRIMITAYNPNAIPESVLPPCHFAAQWTIREENVVDCILYQRSCDLPLGCPTNIASYSLLTFIFCHYCNLRPGKLIHMIGHAHVYKNQIEKAQEHILRTPTKSPWIEMVNMPEHFEDLQVDNFVLKDYTPQTFIKYPFST